MMCPRKEGGSTLGLATVRPSPGCWASLLKPVPVQTAVVEGPTSESSQERGCWLYTQDREARRGFQNISISLFPRDPLFLSALLFVHISSATLGFLKSSGMPGMLGKSFQDSIFTSLKSLCKGNLNYTSCDYPV